MSDKGSQNEDQKGSRKKLLKQEKQLRDRLLEAQQAQDNALERLRRAEARLRKRVERVQRLEGRLSIVDQQMKALNAPLSTIITLIPAVAESAAKESARSPEAVLEQSPQQVVDVVAPETTITPEQPGGLESATGEMVVGEAEPQFLERLSASIDTPLEDKETSDEEVPAALNPAIERAREARAVAEAAEEAARDAIERAEDVAEYLEQIGSARHLMQELTQLEDEAAQAVAYAREAEETAREAERVVAESEGRVPDGEIKLTAEEEQIIASIPPEEERDLDPVEEQDQEESPRDTEQSDIQAILLQQAGEDTSTNGETSGAENSASLSEVANRLNAQADEAHTYLHPTPLEVVKVEEIDEEEETLETVAAMIIADAAAIAAAEAEALAEASSARTREARSAALAADHALGTVRMAVRNGVLVGDEAAAALQIAERDATHAHAVLADAEAAEERARTTAMNAEAEAEVAEGMAFASGERTERDEKLRAEYGTAHPLSAQEPVPAADETNAAHPEQDGADTDQNDREETQKLPRVRPEQA